MAEAPRRPPGGRNVHVRARVSACNLQTRGLLRGKKPLLLLVAALVAAFFALDLGRFLSLAAVKQRQAGLAALHAARPAAALAIFFAACVVVAALSLPGAAVMMLAAGAILGLAAGTVLCPSPPASARPSPSSRPATCCAKACSAASARAWPT